MADAAYLAIGVALLLAVILPRALQRVFLSTPMVLVGFGALLGHAAFPDGDWLWATVALLVTTSVVLHGVSATPALQWLDRRRGGRELTS